MSRRPAAEAPTAEMTVMACRCSLGSSAGLQSGPCSSPKLNRLIASGASLHRRAHRSAPGPKLCRRSRASALKPQCAVERLMPAHLKKADINTTPFFALSRAMHSQEASTRATESSTPCAHRARLEMTAGDEGKEGGRKNRTYKRTVSFGVFRAPGLVPKAREGRARQGDGNADRGSETGGRSRRCGRRRSNNREREERGLRAAATGVPGVPPPATAPAG